MPYEGPYVPFGSTGLRVSRLAFGCGFRGVRDLRQAEEVVVRAIENGINLIDCANVYRLRDGTPAEEVVGRALRGRRDKIILTSKFGAPVGVGHPAANDHGASHRHMIRAVEDSLRRLGTDHLDIYLLHGPDPDTDFEELMLGFDQLRRDGKIRYAGLCNHSAWQVTALAELHKRGVGCPVAVIQNSYSLLNRAAEEELLPAAAYARLGVMAYSPLAAGLLGGAFAHGGPAPEKSTWGHEALYRDYLRYVFPGRVQNIVDAAADLAQSYGVSSATLVTAWVLRQPGVTCAVTGADTWEEFEDSLQAATLALAPADAARLDALSDGMREVFVRPAVQRKLALYHGQYLGHDPGPRQ